MKHSFRVTMYLILLFVCSQIIGVAVMNAYIDPLASQEAGEVVFSNIEIAGMEIEPPPVEQETSFVFIFLAILFGTGLVLLLMKMGMVRLWKAWYFLALVLTISISVAGLLSLFSLPSWIAGVFALLLAGSRVFRPNIISQNLSELLIYAGLASIFVPILNLTSVLALLVLISVYDMYAVWKSRHMVHMANFQTKSNMFAGLYLPYNQDGLVKNLPQRKEDKDLVKQTAREAKTSHKKIKKTSKKSTGVSSAILGGGDIGFPLFFIGVVLKVYGLWFALGIIPFVTASLALLLFYSEKGKFYPAMPIISMGCLIGLRILTFLF